MLVKPGWLAVYGKDVDEEDDRQPRAGAAERGGAHRERRCEGLQTKPPARYTEATLLSAMEGAGKLIDDDELREAMAEKGLARRPRAPPRLKA